VNLRSARILVLTGACLSLIVCALSLFVHNRLYDKDLERAQRTEAALRASLGTRSRDARAQRGDNDVPFQDALAQQPAVRAVSAETLYDEGELKAFEALRMRASVETSPQARSLAPPADVQAQHGMGVVTLSWDPGPVNRVVASTLASQDTGLRLAFRIYREQDGGPQELLATLPFGVTTYRDGQLPLGRSRLSYQVWTVLLRSAADGDVLVGTESSERVTVETPEHFTVNLVGGGPESAVFEVVVDLPAAAGRATVTVHPGEPLRVGARPTGLVLQSITQSQEEKLTTQRRLLLTSDGSLVLDPTTNEPRTTQTQVLLPVTRLTAQLLGQDGETRTLEKDLP